jgi:hypothetical protein
MPKPKEKQTDNDIIQEEVNYVEQVTLPPNTNKLKYSCISCKYFTSNKFDFDKHLSTRKHKNKENKELAMKLLEKSQTHKYVCGCNRNFMSNSGLWRHKKKCQTYASPTIIENSQSDESPEIDESGEITNYVCKCTRNYGSLSGLWKHKKKCTFIDVLEDKKEYIKVTDANIILQLVKQNQDLQTQMLELCKNCFGGNNNIDKSL